MNLAAPAHSLISTAQNKNLIENKFKSKILILSISRSVVAAERSNKN